MVETASTERRPVSKRVHCLVCNGPLAVDPRMIAPTTMVFCSDVCQTRYFSEKVTFESQVDRLFKKVRSLGVFTPKEFRLVLAKAGLYATPQKCGCILRARNNRRRL